MNPKYQSFEDLPSDVADRLKGRLGEGGQRQSPNLPENATREEVIASHRRAYGNPDYTEEQLAAIVDAFNIFNSAVKRGLPDQLYQMMARVLDSPLAMQAYAARAVWYAHEGGDLAKDSVQEFADEVKAEIDRREGWDEEQFHEEYFLKRD